MLLCLVFGTVIVNPFFSLRCCCILFYIILALSCMRYIHTKGLLDFDFVRPIFVFEGEGFITVKRNKY